MNSEQRHGMSGLFVFVLLGLFAVMSIFMVLMGTQMYRSTVSSTEVNRERRILASYLRSMVRSGDQAEGIAVEEIDGIRVIALREAFDDEGYVTRLYVYEGKLYEQFSRERYDFDPELGEEICDAQSLDAEMDGHLLRITAVDGNGNENKVNIYLSSMGS